MGLMESLFDLTYLMLVIGMGVRLLLEKNKNAKLFGIMAVLLGAGDAFHLLPRVISHLSLVVLKPTHLRYLTERW